MSAASTPGGCDLVLRRARPDELDDVGALTVEAYRHGGAFAADDPYLPTLADAAARDATAEVYVAADSAGRLMGTVTVCPPGSPWAEVARPGELEFRMLAVAPWARGRGIARALVGLCVEEARAQGLTTLVLCAIDHNLTAHSLYGAMGFTRQPERDWEPVSGVLLLVWTLQV